jgi:hypothetical protein
MFNVHAMCIVVVRYKYSCNQQTPRKKKHGSGHFAKAEIESLYQVLKYSGKPQHNR